MSDGQKPARVPDGEPGALKGAKREDVIRGSRLTREMGQGAPDGYPEKERGEPVPESRLAAMMQGKRKLRTFTWPGSSPEWKCGIVVLTEEEIEEAGIEASVRLEDARKRMDAINYQERFAQECSVQLLWRALIDPETHRPVALTADELRQHLTTDLMAYFVDIYNEHQMQMSPISMDPTLSKRETREVIEALKKDPEDLLIGAYGADALRHLLRSSVKQIVDSPSSKS